MPNILGIIRGYKERKAKRQILEEFIEKNCGFRFLSPLIGERAFANNNYLIKNATANNEICSVIANPEKMKDDLFKKLINISHTFRKKRHPYYEECSPFQYTEDPVNVYALSNSQLLRVWILMGALGKQRFRNDIGRLIEEDINDPYGEHGGLILFDKNKEAALFDVENVYAKEKNIKNKGMYKMPIKSRNIENIVHYHFHTRSGEGHASEYAGPSQGIPIFGGDLASASLTAVIENESHNVVITKLTNKRFNIDYYGCEFCPESREEKSQYPLVVLDLGNYDYEKQD